MARLAAVLLLVLGVLLALAAGFAIFYGIASDTTATVGTGESKDDISVWTFAAIAGAAATAFVAAGINLV